MKTKVLGLALCALVLTASAHIEEDSPNFNCHAMGNYACEGN